MENLEDVEGVKNRSEAQKTSACARNGFASGAANAIATASFAVASIKEKIHRSFYEKDIFIFTYAFVFGRRRLCFCPCAKAYLPKAGKCKNKRARKIAGVL